MRPRASAGAWSWLRSPGSAGDRGYRKRASLLGQVEGKAHEGKKGVKARLGVGRGSWARLLLGSMALTKGLRSGPTGVWKEAVCTGQGAHTCVDTVVRLHLMFE